MKANRSILMENMSLEKKFHCYINNFSHGYIYTE